MPTPRVLDISHHNTVTADGFQKAAAFGIWGIIAKATQQTNYVDSTYAARRQAIKNIGLLHGAYHFMEPGNVAGQVEFFLRNARPDDRTLLALDWETYNGRVPSAAEAREFLELVHQKTGHKPVVYSGNVAKEKLLTADTFFGSHRLWLAQYSATWRVQKSWTAPWIWQYSGDGSGPTPHGLPGFTLSGRMICDMNHYGGTREQLVAEWAGTGAVVMAPDPVPTGPAILEMTSANIIVLQQKLNRLGLATPPLNADGDFGRKTFTAAMAAADKLLGGQ